MNDMRKANKRFSYILKKVTTILAVFVVFLSTYVMTLPALTLDEETTETSAGIVLDEENNDEAVVYDDTDDEAEVADYGYDPFLVEEERENTINNNAIDEDTDEISLEETSDELKENILSFYDDSTDVIVSVQAPLGAFEEGTIMIVTPVKEEEVIDTVNSTLENDESNNRATKIQAVDISFYYNDEEVEPLLPIKVSLTSKLIKESNKDPKIIHIDDKGEGSIIEQSSDIQSKEDEVIFEAESFSTYVLVITTDYITDEGETYKITITYDEEAEIPEGAYLKVNEITEEDSLYEEYVAKTEEALGLKEGSISYIRLFDITIYDEDDKKIEPEKTVSVEAELTDSTGKQLSVIHFADEDTNGSILTSETDGQTVSFETDSFSVYGIADLDPAETASSVDDLNGNGYYLSTDDGNNRYYYRDPLALVNNVWKFQRATTLDSASRFFFEETETDEQGNRFYIYIYDSEGNKKYVNLTIETNNLRYFELGDTVATATKYTVDIHTEGSPNSFLIYHKRAEKEIYYWNRNGGYFEFAKSTNATAPKNNNTKIVLTHIGANDSTPIDPYGLDGQSLGILWNINDVSGSGMLTDTASGNVDITLTDENGNVIKDENNKDVKVKEKINYLKNRSTTVRIDPVSRTDRVFIAQNSEITMWTFTCCGPAQYYITAVVDGQLKYVRFDDTENHGNSDKGVSLVDTPDDRCKITVTEGTGAYSGKYKFSSNGRTLYNNNGNFFTKAETDNSQNVWMYFAEQSNLNDDDFVVYTAKKVSVSGPVNPDGTVDYDVKDGDQIVIYTRIWNETTLQYEYYMIDYDGMLVRAYMSGDNISWVGSKVNTMLWDFTEYHYLDDDGNETNIPNYYYELQNNYSGKYLAPQVSGEDFLADTPIGINLNGRRYNEYYSTVLAWDDPYYDYAMLMVPNKEYQLNSAPIALANDSSITKDFYFAIMTNDDTGGELSTVETIDHTGFGISVKMINYPGGSQTTADGNFHNMIQTNVLGKTNKTGSVVYEKLLKKNLSENGYPDVALSGYTEHNLGELYVDCTDSEGNRVSETTINHTFLASTYSETGYFEYDCTQNFAHLIESEDDIWYGKPMPGGGTYSVGDFVVYDQLGTIGDVGDTRRHGQFFPYNDLAKEVEIDEDGNTVIKPAYSYSTSMYNTTNIKGQSISSLDARYGEKLYQIPNSPTEKISPYVDHYFGMEMDASFMQSESGLDEFGHDLIFEFSGDDDFWLYIDGKLVLDLGGIHSACDGSVNFRTGEVIVNGRKTNLRTLYKEAYLEENPGASTDEVNEYLDGIFKDGGTVFKDFSGHTMKMFYMERGAGASNIHMRFNLAPYVDGEVQLKKEISGTETVQGLFPFQIWYRDKISAQYVRVGSEGHVFLVKDVSTGNPISHQSMYVVDDVTYNDVYFLTPEQTVSIQLPSEDTEYYIVECGIDPNTYNEVKVNGEKVNGEDVTGSDVLKDYIAAESTVKNRKKVVYDNHVSDQAQKTLTVTKRLWREYGKDTEIYSGDGIDADNTNFRFRIYIGSGTDKTVDGTGYAVYNTGKYYVKNGSGEYCIWENGGFKSTEKTDFSELNTQRVEGEWKSEAEQATFYTSPGGAIDNIRAGYSVEIPGLMAGTPYYIEERSDEIPAGYNLIDYTTTEGAYSSDNTGTEGNSGSIAATDENRTISVHNQHGYGLTVNKIWSDAAFMESHDDIYFGVYLDGSLIENSVRRLHHPETSFNWFFRELADGKTLNDYKVYELELTKDGSSISGEDVTIDPITREVRWDPESGITVIKKEANDSINISGVSNEHGYSVSYSYTVGYDRQELTKDDIANKVNSRTDTVSNARPGIKFLKTDLRRSPLAGAKFVLTDGGMVTKTFISNEDGLIVVSYLENNKEYTLTEMAAPYGYQTLISSISIEKRVNENGETELYVDGEYVNGSVKDETETYELYNVTQVTKPTADNMPTVMIYNKDYTLKAVKVDAYSNEPMKDVEFALYKEVYETVGGIPNPDFPMPDYSPMDNYDTLITDNDGVIPGIFMKNTETPDGLTPGTYYLRETTPSGYNSLGFDIRITILETGNVTLQKAIRPSQSGHWTFDEIPESVADVAYSNGIMQITVKNTPKDPVRIKKLKEGTTKVLAGVEFELYKIGQVEDEKPISGEAPVISGRTDSNGILLLGGLEENTKYYLFETKAAPGYNMLTAPAIITTTGPNTINASLVNTPLKCEKVKDDNNNDVWEITVYNSAGVELPHTGGIGTTIFRMAGLTLILAAGIVLIFKKRH